MRKNAGGTGLKALLKIIHEVQKQFDQIFVKLIDADC